MSSKNNLHRICAKLNDCIYDLKFISDYLGIYDDEFDSIIKSLRNSHNRLCLLNYSIIRDVAGGVD